MSKLRGNDITIIVIMDMYNIAYVGQGIYKHDLKNKKNDRRQKQLHI